MENSENESVVEKELVIRNKLGLHARPAALFVQTANRFEARVEVSKEGEAVNGKSIMGIMTLAVGVGTSIKVKITGSDAGEAMEAIEALIEGNFNE